MGWALKKIMEGIGMAADVMAKRDERKNKFNHIAKYRILC